MPAGIHKLAMIGCGLIARAHGLAAERSERDVMFSFCSSNSRVSANSFAEEFDVDSVYDDHRQLLAGETIDGVVIAAPLEVHANIIDDCLDAGVKYVLCEKPLTMTAVEARAVRAAAQAADAKVIEGFMYRHHSQIEKLVELVRGGELGTFDQLYSSVNMLDEAELGAAPLQENWRRDADVGGGVLHDFLCYPIDIANLVMPETPVRVLTRKFASSVYGTVSRVFGLIEYASGALASIGASRHTGFSQQLVVGCSGGTVRIDGRTTLVMTLGESVLDARVRVALIESG